MASEAYQVALKRSQANVISALFEHLYLVRHKRLPAYWEARLGEALARGDLVVKRVPAEVGLRQVHEVAAEVADALTTSEVVMINA